MQGRVVHFLAAALALAAGGCAAGRVATPPVAAPPRTGAQILADSPASDWRPLRPEDTLVLGFYQDEARRTPIRSVRLAADLPPSRRPALEALETGSATFAAFVEARRNRRDAWYLVPAGRIDLCSVAVPVRPAPPGR